MKKKKEQEPVEEEQTDTKAYFITGIVACVLSAIAFGLCFSPLGIYALITAILLSLASLSFLKTQQKKNPIPQNRIVEIIAYVELGIYAVLFIGGTIYVAVA